MNAAFTEYTASLSNGTLDIPANPKRRGLIIGNPSDTAMTWRVGATATDSAGVPLGAGAAMAFRDNGVPSGSISIFCAGAGKAVTVYEW